MNLKLAIALSFFGIVSIAPALASTNRHLSAAQLISCAPTETQDSSSQQEPPIADRS